MAVNISTYPDMPIVRSMNEMDLKGVLAIESRSYDFPWTEGVFRDCLRVGYCGRVLYYHGVLAAYGIMAVGGGEAHILNLCVKPEMRSRGHGRYMLNHLLHRARQQEASVAVLEVRSSNIPALSLYEQMGFSKIGMRKGYYPAFGGREDALVLMCRL